MSYGVSEQVSKRMSAGEGASEASSTKQAVQSKRMSECRKQTSEQRNKWPSFQRIDFIVSQPTVRHRHCHRQSATAALWVEMA